MQGPGGPGGPGGPDLS